MLSAINYLSFKCTRESFFRHTCAYGSVAILAQALRPLKLFGRLSGACSAMVDMSTTDRALVAFRAFMQVYEELEVTPRYLDQWLRDSLTQIEWISAMSMFGMDCPVLGERYRGTDNTWERWDVRLPVVCWNALQFGRLMSFQELRCLPGLRKLRPCWEHWLPAEPEGRVIYLKRKVKRSLAATSKLFASPHRAR